MNEAKARGARLVVVDPRRAGVAAKADEWLRVRPGIDGALALGIAGVMMEEGWFDRGFLEDWSNGPFLVADEATDAGRPRGGGEAGCSPRRISGRTATPAIPSPGARATARRRRLIRARRPVPAGAGRSRARGD